MEITILASGSSGNAYRISDGTTQLLLDAGIPIREISKRLGFGVCNLSGCLITHEHQDHVKAAKDLIRRSVDVYSSAGTLHAAGISGHRVHTIRAQEEIRLGSWQVLPFELVHDAAEPLGFLLSSTLTREKLLYFTDTAYVRYRFVGVTHMLAECNFDRESLHRSIEENRVHPELARRLFKSHMSLENLLEFLRASDTTRLQQIYLVHLSDTNSNAVQYKQEVQKLVGAEVYIA